MKRNSSGLGILLQTALLAAGLAGLLAPAGRAFGQAVAGEVYYQVTYESGKVVDQSRVPTTDKNIRRVVRIARLNTGDRGLRVLSTERSPVKLRNTGQTFRHELQWDGKAWTLAKIFPRERTLSTEQDTQRDEQRDEASSQLPEKLEDALAAELKRVARELIATRKAVSHQKELIAESEKRVEQASDEDADKARKALAARREKLEELESELDRLKEAAVRLIAGEMGDADGEVTAGVSLSDANDAGGVVKPIEAEHVLTHRVQVWQVEKSLLRSRKGNRRYTVSMAHPEAGRLGEFYYVAYADTDGDGKPDKLIAHSPVARVKQAGAWSSWSFDTDLDVVFVGNAWPREDTAIFCDRYTKTARNWRGLSPTAYVSDVFGGCPSVKAWPFLSNLRVEVQVPWED